jgi:Holliday junction DNA helicase RuvA
MIRSLRGIVQSKEVYSIILDVHGVGYLLFVPTSNHYSVGETYTIPTHLAVRENSLDLYGFFNNDELEFFELLLTLPKIGPKSALTILSQAELAVLEQAIATNDPGYLTKLTGIGKKTAEKIVSGLHDKLAPRTTSDTTSPELSHLSDAVDALIALGYPPNEARKAVSTLPATVTNAQSAVREALKLLTN